MASLRILAGAIALLALLTLAPSAAATHVQCGDVITEDTRLDSDLTGCPGDGLHIGAHGVTLDLNGHTISGDFEPQLSEEAGVVNPGFEGVVIRNGTIRGFALVINAGDGGPVDASVIRNITGDSFFGDLFLFGDGIRVEKNTFLGGGENSINVHGDGIVITKNLIVGDNDIAIIVSGDRNEITKNTIRSGAHCMSFIDVTGEDNTVAKNDATATGGYCLFGN